MHPWFEKGPGWRFCLILCLLALSPVVAVLLYMLHHFDLADRTDFFLCAALLLLFYAALAALYLAVRVLFRRVDRPADQVNRCEPKPASGTGFDASVASPSDSDALLNSFLDRAVALTQARKGSLFLVDRKQATLSLVNARGIEDLAAGARIPIDQAPLLKRVIAERRMLLVHDIEREADIGRKNNPRYETPSFLIVPVSSGSGEVVAVINLTGKEAGAVFDAQDAGALSIVQTGIGISLENRQLQTQLEITIADLTEKNRELEKEVAARRAAEASKKELYAELIRTEKLAAVGTCAAGIAHELKNPLAIIVQGVAYLESSLATDRSMQDVTSRINDAVMRADMIVRGLLSFTRQVPLQTEKTDMASLVDESLALIAEKLREGGIAVVKHYDADIPPVFVDGGQMKQVLINVLMNAVEALTAGGTITVDIGSIADVTLGVCVELTIRDSGPGMPADVLAMVFEPFYTTKNHGGNVGLGLSLSKGIVDMHHGKITIKSQMAQGTMVTIRLPLEGPACNRMCREAT